MSLIRIRAGDSGIFDQDACWTSVFQTAGRVHCRIGSSEIVVFLDLDRNAIAAQSVVGARSLPQRQLRKGDVSIRPRYQRLYTEPWWITLLGAKCCYSLGQQTKRQELPSK